MYLEYYSLDRPPFRITPDPSLFFTGGANGRGVVLEALLYAINSGEGILKVVGEVGSGKTMLCRMLEERLPESVEVVYLANPNLSAHDILYAIAFELKLAVDNSTPRIVLMHLLQEYLLKQHALNRNVLVMIEEAQSMPIDTLEEIRLFSNLETHQYKLMQIVLFGQPELNKNLEKKNIRQLKERITHSFDLHPLNASETSDYIRFRLHAAGCPCPQVFSDGAEKLIARASGGLTRRINILADKAMLAAYAESATSTRQRTIGNQLMPSVTVRHVKAAIRDSNYGTWAINKPRVLAAAAVSAVLLLSGLWWWVGGVRMPPVLPAAEALTQAVETVQPPTAAVAEIAAVQASVPAAPPVAIPVAAPAPAEQQVDTTVIPSVPPQETVAAAAVTEPPVAIEPSQPVMAYPRAVADIREAAVIESDPIVAEPVEAIEAASLDTATTGDAEVRDVALLQPKPQPAREPAGAASRAEPVSLIAERFSAYGEWIQTSPQVYAVQLGSMSSGDTRYVEFILEQVASVGLIDSTYVCRSSNQDGYVWRIFSGSFAKLNDARLFITNLPAPIRANDPYVQNIDRLNCDGQ